MDGNFVMEILIHPGTFWIFKIDAWTKNAKPLLISEKTVKPLFIKIALC